MKKKPGKLLQDCDNESDSKRSRKREIESFGKNRMIRMYS